MSNSSTNESTAAPGTRGHDERTPFRYDANMANTLEPKWQDHWRQRNTFRVANPGDDGFDASKPKYYVLDMFPYPSGAGLHVGHPEGYTATDIVSRYKRLCGYNVLHPMGWDAFGLPAEQYAIATGVHPAITTTKAIDTFRRQLQRFGFCYDWEREFATIDEDYYRWTQWIWLKAYTAWYDPVEDRARPIDDLVRELEDGSILVGIDRAIVKTSGEVKPDPTARPWSALSDVEQREFVDAHRLAYLAEQTVNWCPALGTALANEEVIDGKSERGHHPVYRKPLKQWMFRITAYAERLLNDLDHMDWPDSTRIQQREWIGRSEGAEVDFTRADAPNDPDKVLRVFTTRPDTLFGATFMVVAPEHPLVDEMLAAPPAELDADALRAYVDAARHRSDVDRMADTKDKTGVFTGAYAINPVNDQRIPIWTADYVMMTYGHGAIMAVPAHDQRDHDFATKFGIPIVQVIEPLVGQGSYDPAVAFSDPGRNVNSANASVSIDGMETAEAKVKITQWLEEQGIGAARVNYKLRDWLFSRQRYWGEPFPVVFDERGNHYPVDESHLPVQLPQMQDYEPVHSDEPQPLLAKATDWVQTTAGEAGVSPDVLPPDTKVWRETNTMPGWAGSCWYYLRFCDPKNNDRFIDRGIEAYWMGTDRDAANPGVDLYIGGAEHSVLHLLYARFWHKILFDLGEVTTPEPFTRLFHQGLITSFAYQSRDGRILPIDEVYRVSIEPESGDALIYDFHDEIVPDPASAIGDQALHYAREHGEAFVEASNGIHVKRIIAKMSKSLKNVVNPDDVIAEYGADTFRLYEMYMGPLEASKPWNTRDIVGPYRFLQRVWRLAVDERTGELTLRDQAHEDIERLLHQTIVKVGDDIDRLAMNTAIAAMIEFTNEAGKAGGLTVDQWKRFAVILSPFAPHIAEELWAKLGGEGCVADADWPPVDASMLVADTIELPVQILGKVRSKITVPAEAANDAVEEAALADARIAELLEGKTVRKVIIVPGKIVNIIAQ